MKKIFIASLLLFLCCGGLFSQNASVINGVWERGNPQVIKLFRVNKGDLSEIASSKLNEKKQFSFAFIPEKEGYFVIGLSASNRLNRYTFYFKPGDLLNLAVKANSYELTGDTNTKENKEMAGWQDFIFPIEDKAVYFMGGKNSTYVDFFPLFEEKLAELKNYPAAKTGNTIFDSSFEEYKKCNILDLAINFIMTPRSAHPQGEDFPDYYRDINIADLSKDNFLMEYPGGLNLLVSAYLTTIRLSNSLSESDKAARMSEPASFLLGGADNDKIASSLLKGELALKMARQNKTPEGFTDYKQKFEKYLVNDDQKARMKNIESSISKNAKGTDAIDFKFPDINGKEIALSDFKGKVVYIDVWATWCGPCKKEFPFLKNLEADFHGNDNIIFMGVNVDISKDIQKWKNFLDKEQLPGIQLFAGDDAPAKLMSPYGIKSIPRFILVGKDGKVIFSDAPRPSSPELKAIINNALKK